MPAGSPRGRGVVAIPLHAGHDRLLGQQRILHIRARVKYGALAREVSMKSCLSRVLGTISVAAVIATAPLAGQQPPPAGAPAQAPRPVPLKSPEIHPDRTVTFRLLAPKATEVTLNGSWDNGTDLKMTKDESGVWSTTIGPLAPQLWGYWFVVDGVKALDPNNGETQRDGARYDNLLMISGPESEWWDFKDAPHGTVQAVWYPSPTLKMASRRMMVYTPFSAWA